MGWEGITVFARRTSIERYVADLGIAVIMPSTDLAWYTDTQYDMNYWTFISEELPRICHQLFPQLSTKRENLCRWFVNGWLWRLEIRLAKPESFAAVALSGAVSLSSTSFGELLKVRKRSYWEGIFGPLDQIEGSIHDPLYLLQQLVESQTEMPQFYLFVGSKICYFLLINRWLKRWNRHRQVTLLKLDQENMTGCSGMNGFKSLGLATNTKIEKVVFAIYFSSYWSVSHFD